MKELVKSLLFAMIFACFFTACKDDDDEKKEEVQAQFLSFGFYAEDNEGVLFEDYLVESPVAAIDVTMPAEIDKSNLIARFTTTDNDVVTVENRTQESGVTANDFKNPVDYFVSEGIVNTKYTVTIKKAADKKWAKLSTFAGDSVGDIIFRINPKDNVPYVAYIQDNTNTDDRKAAVVKYANGQWQQLGSVAGVSEGRVSDLDLAFSNDGVPYIAYSDYKATPSQNATVLTYNGTAWNIVGKKGLNDVKVTYKGLGFDKNNTPMLFAMNDAAGALARRMINVCKFTGGAWETSGSISGRPALNAYYPTTKLFNGLLYVAIFNAAASPQTYSIYTYDGTSWATIEAGRIDEGVNNQYLGDFDMTVDALGNIYIASGDNETGSYKIKVKKLDVKKGTWSTVGGSPVDFVISSSTKYSIAVSPWGVPYLAYRGANNLPLVRYIDSETKQWTDDVTLENIVISDIWIDFDADGNGYVAYYAPGAGNKKIILQKYN